jgi:long-chain fatty acid transport protein
MKKVKIFLSVFVCLVFLCSLGFSNGLNLNGIGARAIAMGGAFVGLADDFSAVFWNPAGLGQLKRTTFGLTGMGLLPKGSYSTSIPNMFYPNLDPTLDVDAELPSTIYFGGLAGIYTPVGDSLVAGLAVYTPSGLGANWNGPDFAEVSGIPGIPNSNINWKSFFGIITLSPALAVNLQDRYFFGATLNVNYGMFNIGRTAGWMLDEMTSYRIDMGQYEESSTGLGFGATLGALLKPIDQLSFGVSLRMPSIINFSGDASLGEYGTIEGFFGLDLSAMGLQDSSDLERKVTSPMWLGIGLAFQPIEKLTVTADAHYTNWKKLSTIETSYADVIWQIFLQEEAALNLNWMDKWQFRVGAELRISDNFALRVGYYNDPAPAPDETMNVLLPSFNFNSLTAGIGYSLDGLQIDLALEYLMGNERDIPFQFNPVTMQLDYEQPGVYNLNVLSINLSLSYGIIR